MLIKATQARVSLPVALSEPGRTDLFMPVGQVRDEEGKIIGATGLARIYPRYKARTVWGDLPGVYESHDAAQKEAIDYIIYRSQSDGTQYDLQYEIYTC